MSIEYYYIYVKSQSYYHPYRKKQANAGRIECFSISNALPNPSERGSSLQIIGG